MATDQPETRGVELVKDRRGLLVRIRAIVGVGTLDYP